MNDNLPTPPEPQQQLLGVLDPRGDVDYGLAITIVHDLASDTAIVLAELVGKTVARARADAYDRGHAEAKTVSEQVLVDRIEAHNEAVARAYRAGQAAVARIYLQTWVPDRHAEPDEIVRMQRLAAGPR